MSVYLQYTVGGRVDFSINSTEEEWFFSLMNVANQLFNLQKNITFIEYYDSDPQFPQIVKLQYLATLC